MNLQSLSALGLSLFATVALVSGCSKKEETKAGSPTQVAAKVNSDEITVSQINSVMARNQTIPADAAETMKFDILSKLVDQDLAKQQAISMKLDRTPETMQEVEAARNEILARAYLNSIVRALPKPSPEDIKKYYSAHPELFSDRRIYTLEELAMAPTPGLLEKLNEQIPKARSLPELANWLKAQDVKFTANRGARPAESIPMEYLPVLSQMKEGEMRAVGANGRVFVYRLVSAQSAPVDENTAARRIAQFLFNRKANDAVASAMKGLRDKSEISYRGEFEGGAASIAARAKADADAKAKAQAEEKIKDEAEAKIKAEARAKADAEAQARLESLAKARAEREAEAAKSRAAAPADKAVGKSVSQETIDKGLRGLK